MYDLKFNKFTYSLKFNISCFYENHLQSLFLNPSRWNTCQAYTVCDCSDVYIIVIKSYNIKQSKWLPAMMSLTFVAIIALYSVDSELVLWTTSTMLSLSGNGNITLEITWMTPLVAFWLARVTLQPLAVTTGGGSGYNWR
jgi:hypothetical protein